MNLLENVKEAIRSVKSNLLRTILTGLIIAIGITSLVAMLTAIDGMKAQIEESFSGFGANNFDVRSKRSSGDRKSTRLNSSHVRISYAVFCLKKKTKKNRSKATFSKAINWLKERSVCLRANMTMSVRLRGPASSVA